ncbi:hypothetical protein REPUB_Repub03eG0139100 [Reevesia pubescens]
MHIVIDSLRILTQLPFCLMVIASEANKFLVSWKWRMVMRLTLSSPNMNFKTPCL